MNYLDKIRGFRLTVESVKGNCSYEYQQGQIIESESLAPDGICPYLYNNLIPYHQVFQNGGYFKWRKNINTVEVMCPNPQGMVNVEITRPRAGFKGITHRVVSVGGTCAASYMPGDLLEVASASGLCPYAFAALFPAAIKCMHGNKLRDEAQCQSMRGSVKFSFKRRLSE